MNEVRSPSNVEARASKVRPTWSSSETRRNYGSVQPVQPVQPFLESYKNKVCAHRESQGEQYLPETFYENTLDRLDVSDTPCFSAPYKNLTLDIGWTYLGRNEFQNLTKETLHHV
jgi:hypothetical protein